MTTTPTSNPTWATDTTVATGPEVGLPTKVTPSDGVRQQGFLSGQGVPARTVNGQLGAIGTWIQYLREALGDRLTTTPRKFRLNVAAVGELNLTPTDQAFQVNSPFSEFGSGNNVQLVLSQLKSGCTFLYQITGQVPQDSLITNVQVTVQGSSAFGVLPSGLPSITLSAVTDDGTVLSLGFPVVEDTSATAGEFTTQHTLEIDLSATPLDADTAGNLSGPVRLYLVITGATGGPSMPDVFFANPCVSCISKPWT